MEAIKKKMQAMKVEKDNACDRSSSIYVPRASGRKIKSEAKAKVVAAVWRTELIQFLDALAILHQDDLKKG